MTTKGLPDITSIFWRRQGQNWPCLRTTGLEELVGGTKVRKLLHIPEGLKPQTGESTQEKRNVCVPDTGINTEAGVIDGVGAKSH